MIERSHPHLGVLPHAAQPPRLRRHALEPREGRDDDEDALVAEELLALLDPRERVVQAVDEVRPDDEVEGAPRLGRFRFSQPLFTSCNFSSTPNLKNDQ